MGGPGRRQRLPGDRADRVRRQGVGGAGPRHHARPADHHRIGVRARGLAGHLHRDRHRGLQREHHASRPTHPLGARPARCSIRRCSRWCRSRTAAASRLPACTVTASGLGRRDARRHRPPRPRRAGRRQVRRPRHQRHGQHDARVRDRGLSVTAAPVDVSALPAEATTGKWGPLVQWAIVPLHIHLLRPARSWAGASTRTAVSWAPWQHAAAVGSRQRARRLPRIVGGHNAVLLRPHVHGGRPADGLRRPQGRTTRASTSPTSSIRPARRWPRACPRWRSAAGTRPSPCCPMAGCSRWPAGIRPARS